VRCWCAGRVEQGTGRPGAGSERRDLGRQRERLRQPRFHFAGFLPRKVKARAGMLDELRPLRAQLVFYESPHRLAATLGDLQAALGDRPAWSRES